MEAWQNKLEHEEKGRLAAGYVRHFEQFPGSMVDAVLQWEEFRGLVEEFLSCCGSPIERKLIIALAAYAPALAGMCMGTQSRVGAYTADISLSSILKPFGILVAIECDGAEFHQNNPAQVARDKKRDRFFISQGITTVRYTGSEIFKDADACASEAAGIFWRLEAERQKSA